jgi:hypothetical protein
MVLTVDADDGEVFRFVVAVFGEAGEQGGHGAGNLSVPK